MKITFRLFFFISVLSIFTPVSVNAVEVSREEWIDSMTTILPSLFCQSDQFFIQCFNVTQAKCEETALSTTRICLKKNADKIPEILVQPRDGAHWGEIIGKCTGEAYAVVLRKELISSPQCDEQNFK